MFLLEAAHVGNIDSTYFVSIQATSSVCLGSPRPRTPPSQVDACNAALGYLVSPISYLLHLHTGFRIVGYGKDRG